MSGKNHGGDLVGNGKHDECMPGLKEDDMTMEQSSGEEGRTIRTETEGFSEEMTKISFLERNSKHKLLSFGVTLGPIKQCK